MGGLLAFLGGAAGTYGAEREADQKRQDDLNDYKVRQEFANTLQMNLLEKQKQLAVEYPTYAHFVTNPVDNSVTGITNTGDAKQLLAGDPAVKDLFMANKQAIIDQKKAQGLLDASSVTRNNAMADYYNHKASSPAAAKDNGISAADFKTRVTMAAQQIDPGAWAPIDKITATDPNASVAVATRRAAAIAKAEQRLRAQGIHMKQESAAEDSSGEVEDNPFMDPSNFNQPDDPNNL